MRAKRKWAAIPAHPILALGLFSVGLVILNGCGEQKPPTPEQPPAEQPPAEPAEAEPPAKLTFTDLERPGLQHVVQLTPQLISGSQPHGEEGFESLEELGVKTIVSVDGAPPAIDLAKKHGIRYVHIPIGYDGVPREAELAIVRVMRDAAGPIYFHCHHGKHRGPAAAAVACIAAGIADTEQAKRVLEKAGTSPDYAGLWRDVAEFKMPTTKETLPELQAQAKVTSLAAAMAKLDRTYDEVVLCQVAGWKPPADHPDLVPLNEALLIKEQFRESARLLPENAPADLKAGLEAAEKLAQEMEDAVREMKPEVATAKLAELKTSCTKCHQKFRDNITQ